MDIKKWLFNKKDYYKSVYRSVATLIYINQYMFVFLVIGAVGGIISIFFRNAGFLISSNIFTFIGLVIGYKQSPKFTIAYILGVIFLTSVTLAFIFNSEKYQIIGIGITLLLVVLTFWYSSIMLQQVRIMNNEKLGKVISEISRSIFSPLWNELIDVRDLLNSKSYVLTILPTKLTIGGKEENLINLYTKGEIEIYPISSEEKKPIKRFANRLLKIDDEDLKFVLLLLDEDNKEFIKNIHNLNELYKRFDGDLLAYWVPFKEECNKRIQSQNINPYLSTEFAEIDYLTSLKHVYIQKAFTPYHPNILMGRQDELPRFISENKAELFVWLQDIPILKEDMENIKKIESILIENVITMLGRINFLLSTWKIKYYLTEEELQIFEGTNVV